MAYPKPLSQKTIDKMFSTWKPETVDTLHRYYQAFSELYGCIMLRDAWKVFQQLEPKIHKKEFIEFSAIARREDLPYYIYEIDELYYEEKRIDTKRFIVNKKLIRAGYGKLSDFYSLVERQGNKPYYNKPDLLAVAQHPFHDTELRAFLDQMKFTKGKYKGKKFSERGVITPNEEFDMEYFKSKSRRDRIREQAELPLTEKFMEELIYLAHFASDPLSSAMEYLEDLDYVFPTQLKVERFMLLVSDFINHSHLWVNCGYTPTELMKMYDRKAPKMLSLGPGIQKAIADGDIDEKEMMAKLKAMGFEVES